METFSSGSPDDIPNYVRLFKSGELRKRASRALERLDSCQVCPRHCEVNRLEGERKFCRSGRYARIASYGPHLGEENCLRGLRGSGTIFFTGCNLCCVFCQNFDISQADGGIEVTPELLSDIMVELQTRGCHNVNLVSPTHVVPQWLEALPHAVDSGLRLPIVYNTNAFDSLESLRLIDGVVDVYMPDFKYWDADRARRYLKTSAYPDAARAALKEMHRQVGDLRCDKSGLARRGLLVRHLVMPGGIEETQAIMRFLSSELSPHTYVNIMAQYRPANRVDSAHYPELDRPVTPEEMAAAYQAAQDAGLHRFDERRRASGQG